MGYKSGVESQIISADDMIVGKPKDSTKRLLELMKEFG